MIVDAEYIEMLTGIQAECFTEEILLLSEAKARQLLGYLFTETRVKDFYIYTTTRMLNLPEIPSSITKIEFRNVPGDYSEITPTQYRLIDQTLRFELILNEDADVKITYTVGWDSAEIPDLVRLSIVYICLDTLNSLKPGTVQINEIDSYRIGDYSVKYHFNASSTNPDVMPDTLSLRIDKVVVLIKQGSYEPGVVN